MTRQTFHSLVGTGGVADMKFLKKSGATVVENDDPTLVIGFTQSAKSAAENVGMIVWGQVRVPSTVNATYMVGDKVELDVNGQKVKLGTTNKIGVVAKAKTTTTDDNSLLVMLDLVN